MTHFSAALERAMRSANLSQSELRTRIGVSQGQISSYFNGDRVPEGGTLLRLCAAFPEDDQADLAAAYLRDQLPAPLRRLVRIETATGVLREDPPLPAVLRNLPPATARLIEETARLCESDARFATALRGIVKLSEDPAERRRER